MQWRLGFPALEAEDTVETEETKWPSSGNPMDMVKPHN
jgi:hypothetical protein